MKHLFTDTDREKIEHAVQEAEQRTSGEIVPVIVAQADDYPFVSRRAGIAGLIVGAVVFELVKLLSAGWDQSWYMRDIALFAMMIAGALLAAFAVGKIPGLRRRLIGRNAMDRAVHNRAVHAFVEEEVFNTRDRTGILLLVSLFEHRVEVLGDSGINSLVEEDDWVEVIEDVVTGIKRGEAAAGLVQAIQRCGELLERKGVARQADDQDELSNRLRIK